MIRVPNCMYSYTGGTGESVAKFNIICDRICEKGSYTRIRFCNFDEA